MWLPSAADSCFRWLTFGLCMSSRNKRTHGDCIWYTVGATVLMALVKHVVEGIVIVVVDVVGEFWAVSVLR